MLWSQAATKNSATWASSSLSNPIGMTKAKKLRGPKTAESIVAHGCCRVDLAGGTLDLWPLYLFHPGAVTVNMGINIMTHCRITPTKGNGIWLRSLDTGTEDSFANATALVTAQKYRHALAGNLCRFFLQ